MAPGLCFRGITASGIQLASLLPIDYIHPSKLVIIRPLSASHTWELRNYFRNFAASSIHSVNAWIYQIITSPSQ
jgi:hypothetical protein